MVQHREQKTSMVNYTHSSLLYSLLLSVHDDDDDDDWISVPLS